MKIKPIKLSHASLLMLLTAMIAALAIGVTGALTQASNQRPDAPVKPRVDITPAPGITPEFVGEVELDGQRWAVKRYLNAAGDVCAGEYVPGEGQAVGCWRADDFKRLGPLWLQVGARQKSGGDLTKWDNAWVWGFVDTDVVNRAEIVMTNCSRQPVRIDRFGVFLRVYGASMLHRNVWPARIDAFDSSGSLVGSRDIPLSVPPTEAAKQAGVNAPALLDCG